MCCRHKYIFNITTTLAPKRRIKYYDTKQT